MHSRSLTVRPPARLPRSPRLLRHEIVVPGLAPVHDGLRVAHITDVHVGLLTPRAKIRRAFARAQAEHPDLIALTGDFLCYSPKFVPLLGELVCGLATPTVAVLGNHDYWTDAAGVQRVLERAGYAVLKNGWTSVTLRGEPLHVVGIDDAVTGHADPARAHRGLPPGGSRLTLSHVPSVADRLTPFGPSLTLSGHTHGGHINIPRLTARIAARLGNHYLAGFYDVPGGGLLYVNRGVGSSSVPFRANAPSEVALLTLRAHRR